MAEPSRIQPLLDQFDHATERLSNRLAGGEFDSGDGQPIEVPAMETTEYLWEPVDGCWSVRRRATGPGFRATALSGSGEWGIDAANAPHPFPPPFTTIAWRLSHLTELLLLRADYTVGTHALTRAGFEPRGTAAEALADFTAAAAAWRRALRDTSDDAFNEVGRCSYPYGSDADDPFSDVAWWVNQEVLLHGAEIALLRDLYRELG
jgi:hypothetical protein